MIPVLFENDDILAINKPEGLASIPEGAKGRDCLLSLLALAFPEKLYVVHRLDKEVSGVILFAKSAAAHKHLNDQFSNGNVKKTYIALTHGDIKENRGIGDAIRFACISTASAIRSLATCDMATRKYSARFLV